MYFINIVEVKSALLNRYVSPVVFFKAIFYLQYRRSKRYKCCMYLCNRSLKHLIVRYNQYVGYNDNIWGVRKDLCSIFLGGGGQFICRKTQPRLLVGNFWITRVIKFYSLTTCIFILSIFSKFYVRLTFKFIWYVEVYNAQKRSIWSVEAKSYHDIYVINIIW